MSETVKEIYNPSESKDILTCEDCSFIASNGQSLRLHTNTKHAQKKHDIVICKICWKEFMNKMELKIHWDETSLHCKTCKTCFEGGYVGSFSAPNKIILDFKEHQGHELEEVEFKCDGCMFFCKTFKTFDDHIGN